MSDDPVHNHQRSGDTDDLHGQRLQAAVESTFAKTVGRFVTPMLLTAMLGIVSFVSVRALDWMASTSKDIEAVKSDVRDLNTRFNESAIRRIDENARVNARQDDDIRQVKERVAELRAVVKVP